MYRELTKENVTLAFDPEKAANPDLREVFRSSKARALWLAYRCHHLIDQYTEVALPKACLTIAQEIESSEIKEIRIEKALIRSIGGNYYPSGINIVQPILSEDFKKVPHALANWDASKLARWLAGRLLAGSRWEVYDAFCTGAFPKESYYSKALIARIKQDKEPPEPADAWHFAEFIRPYLLDEKIAEYTVSMDDGR